MVNQLLVIKKCEIGEPIIHWIFSNVSDVCNVSYNVIQLTQRCNIHIFYLACLLHCSVHIFI